MPKHALDVKLQLRMQGCDRLNQSKAASSLGPATSSSLNIAVRQFTLDTHPTTGFSNAIIKLTQRSARTSLHLSTCIRASLSDHRLFKTRFHHEASQLPRSLVCDRPVRSSPLRARSGGVPREKRCRLWSLLLPPTSKVGESREK